MDSSYYESELTRMNSELRNEFNSNNSNSTKLNSELAKFYKMRDESSAENDLDWFDKDLEFAATSDGDEQDKDENEQDVPYYGSELSALKFNIPDPRIANYLSPSPSKLSQAEDWLDSDEEIFPLDLKTKSMNRFEKFLETGKLKRSNLSTLESDPVFTYLTRLLWMIKSHAVIDSDSGFDSEISDFSDKEMDKSLFDILEKSDSMQTAPMSNLDTNIRATEFCDRNSFEFVKDYISLLTNEMERKIEYDVRAERRLWLEALSQLENHVGKLFECLSDKVTKTEEDLIKMVNGRGDSMKKGVTGMQILWNDVKSYWRTVLSSASKNDNRSWFENNKNYDKIQKGEKRLECELAKPVSALSTDLASGVASKRNSPDSETSTCWMRDESVSRTSQYHANGNTKTIRKESQFPIDMTPSPKPPTNRIQNTKLTSDTSSITSFSYKYTKKMPSSYFSSQKLNNGSIKGPLLRRKVVKKLL